MERGVRPMGLWSMAMTLSRCSMPSMRSCLPGRAFMRFSSTPSFLYSTSLTSELLPLPLTPVTQMNVPNGNVTSMLFRLFSRAPRTVRTLEKRFEGLRILNAYGPTEATCAVTSAEITPALAQQEALPIGHDGGEAVEVLLDQHGRITLQGKSVAVGYLGGERFSDQFPTGDLGRLENGLLWYIGRCDDQIKYKGYRIEPGEIEAAMTALPGVRQAVVLPRKDRFGRVISLRALAAAEDNVREDDLRRSLRQTLPDYMIPRQIAFCAALPITANGKTDRRQAMQMADALWENNGTL